MNERVTVSRLQLRKRPQQERSVQRLELIMDATIRLVLEKGALSVTMSEIAQQAGIPIGSLYQFFPQKAAIIKALHDRLSKDIDSSIAGIFRGVTSREEAADRAADVLFDLHDKFRQQPIFLAIWHAITTDRDLAHVSHEYHDHLIRSFHKDLIHVVPAEEFPAFRVNLKLLIVTSGEVMRFAASLGPEAGRIYLEQWRRIIRQSIFAF